MSDAPPDPAAPVGLDLERFRQQSQRLRYPSGYTGLPTASFEALLDLVSRQSDALEEMCPPMCERDLKVVNKAIPDGSGLMTSTFEHAADCRRCRIRSLLPTK